MKREASGTWETLPAPSVLVTDGRSSERLMDRGAFGGKKSAIESEHDEGRRLNQLGRNPRAGKESDRLVVL